MMQTKQNTPNPERLHELFRIEDSKLYWRTPAHGKNINKPIGNRMNPKRVPQVMVDGKVYIISRVLYCMYHNTTLTTKDFVVHLDGDQRNHSKENLAVMDKSSALTYNRKLQSNNTTGYANVYELENHYIIKFFKNGKYIYEECFSKKDYTIEEVAKFRDEKRKALNLQYNS